MICSNCDMIRVYIGSELVDELQPDRQRFGALPHPPFFCDKLHGLWGARWHDLRLEGFLGGQLVAVKQMSGRGVDRQFHATADDTVLLGDGIDVTRIVLRVSDEFGAARPFATGAVQFTLEGSGEIVGENPFALVGGVGAVWVKTREAAGTIRLHAIHPILGAKEIEIVVEAVPEEAC